MRGVHWPKWQEAKEDEIKLIIPIIFCDGSTRSKRNKCEPKQCEPKETGVHSPKWQEAKEDEINS
jgi:hypothetical protein